MIPKVHENSSSNRISSHGVPNTDGTVLRQSQATPEILEHREELTIDDCVAVFS